MISRGEWKKLQITVEGVDEVLSGRGPNAPDPWELAQSSLLWLDCD